LKSIISGRSIVAAVKAQVSYDLTGEAVTLSFEGITLCLAQPLIIDTFEPDMLSDFTSSDPDQFAGRRLTGYNGGTDIPGLWRVIDGKPDPPQGTFLDNMYCPMFEQIIDHRILKNVRINVTLFTGEGGRTDRAVDAHVGSSSVAWMLITSVGFISTPREWECACRCPFICLKWVLGSK
jgi:hypothetical protein